MIDGLVFEFTSTELKEHFAEREKYHAGKVKWYAGQVDNLTQGGVDATGHSNDPVGSLRSSTKQHQRQADYFRLLGKHIIPDEVYRLNESDLGRAELVSSIY